MPVQTTLESSEVASPGYAFELIFFPVLGKGKAWYSSLNLTYQSSFLPTKITCGLLLYKMQQQYFKEKLLQSYINNVGLQIIVEI